MSSKAVLSKFSKNLRRDFLAVLVKMIAFHEGTKTVRDDWRTRSGMLDYIDKHWTQLQAMIENDPPTRWYCFNFQCLETILSDRKFSLYLYKHWSDYDSILTRIDVVTFLRYQQNEVKELITQKEEIKLPPVWAQFQCAIDFFKIIESYQCKDAGIPSDIFFNTNTVTKPPIVTEHDGDQALCTEVSSPVVEDIILADEFPIDFDDIMVDVEFSWTDF